MIKLDLEVHDTELRNFEEQIQWMKTDGQTAIIKAEQRAKELNSQ